MLRSKTSPAVGLFLICLHALACTTGIQTETKDPFGFPGPSDPGLLPPEVSGGGPRRPPPTPIDVRYAALDGPSGPLGAPSSPEIPLPGGTGRVRHFEHGSIYWSPDTGAHDVRDPIRQRWLELGAQDGFLGYPTTDHQEADDGLGRFSDFQGGSIHWSPTTGAREVHGEIRRRWQAGPPKGLRTTLGYPVTDELPTSDRIGRYQVFQRGAIVWSPERGAHWLHGPVSEKWLLVDLSVLGYPLMDGQVASDGVGRFTDFERGSIYFTPATGAHEIHGEIREEWLQRGAEKSFLQYPITDEEPTEDGAVSFFQGGYLRFSEATGEVRAALIPDEPLVLTGTPRSPWFRPGTGVIASPPVSPKCVGEGSSCTGHPPECAVRGSSWTVPGTVQCVAGAPFCIPTARRDYCNQCGGECGGCFGESCSATGAFPCAPGLVCTNHRECTDCEQRWECRPVGEGCIRIQNLCWTKAEVGIPQLGCAR